MRNNLINSLFIKNRLRDNVANTPFLRSNQSFVAVQCRHRKLEYLQEEGKIEYIGKGSKNDWGKITGGAKNNKPESF